MAYDDTAMKVLESAQREAALYGVAFPRTSDFDNGLVRSGAIDELTSVSAWWKHHKADALSTAYDRMQADPSVGAASLQAYQSMLKYAESFTLPSVVEAARLIEQSALTSYSNSILHQFLPDNATLLRAIESFQMPWLNTNQQALSVASFKEIQSIGSALKSLPAFDESLSSALRGSLGDWRDPITWPSEVFTDMGARYELYTGLGFKTALTDFPTSAFDQTIQLAGLGDDEPAGDEKNVRQNDALAELDEASLQRTNQAHDRLMRLEMQLRHLIDRLMTKSFGPNWYRLRLPKGLHENWQEKRAKALQHSEDSSLPLIVYADFTDYEPIICRKDNWREIFAPIFRRPESVRESFQRLYPIRIDTMHARPITRADELLLHVEFHQLMKAIKRPISS